VLKIDGSYGEGGGQIVRSAVTLSCITKKPIQIENIREKRKVPGLRPQHLMAIKLLSKISGAEVSGLDVGSKAIKFIPKNVESRTITENIGTAGSISLMLQALIPAVSLSGESLKLSIIGGTDVPWSPTSYYTKYVLGEAYSRMGINFSMDIKKRGYYPKGGGLIELIVYPSKKLKPISLTKRKTKSAKLFCSYSNLSSEKIKNEVQRAETLLEEADFKIDSEIQKEIALDKGGTMLVYSTDTSSIVGSDGLTDTISDLGKRISKNFIKCNLGTDNHLSDMLVLPASLIDETSVYRITEITKHLETNLYVTSKITGCKYGIGRLDDGFEVRIKGKSNSTIQ
jgi:RNA 3'-terminal phosphate cyclase (ATP)